MPRADGPVLGDPFSIVPSPPKKAGLQFAFSCPANGCGVRIRGEQ